ncbi:hypothetical protein GCM10027072_56590 [Streptomyces bullii]
MSPATRAARNSRTTARVVSETEHAAGAGAVGVTDMALSSRLRPDPAGVPADVLDPAAGGESGRLPEG